jgi:hypothetical protein
MQRLIMVCATLGGLTAILAGAATAADTSSKVLRHVVMYKFRDDATPAQVQKVIDTFAGLPKQVDTIVGFEHGPNVSQEGKSEGFTHCFVVTFRDEAGLKKYIDHPAHAAYVEVVKPVREKVIVFDYWHAGT